MMLTTAAVAEFDAGDRQRGHQTDMLTKVTFLDVGSLGVRAHVDGSHGEVYSVMLDFRFADESELGVFCDCPRFADGYPCKHAWATMTKFDLLYDSPLGETPHLELHEVEPEEFDTGEELFSAIRQIAASGKTTRTNRKAAIRTSTKPSSPSKDAWRTQLGKITRAMNGHSQPTQFGLPADLLPESAHRSQHWFVFSISQHSNAAGLQLSSMRSTRKNDGGWGRPVGTEVTAAEISEITDETERQAFAFLQPDEEQTGYHRYAYHRAGHRLYSVEPALLRKSLEAMHKTKRLAWKLGDSRQHFEDAQPVDEISVEQSTTMRLQIAPDTDKQSEIVVTAELVVPDFGIHPVEQLIWSSEIGCGLINLDHELRSEQPHEAALEVGSELTLPSVNQVTANENASGTQYSDDQGQSDLPIRTCLVAISPDRCSLIQAWQKTKSIRVPRKNLEALLVELSASHGDVDLSVDASFGFSEHSDQPLARCWLDQKEPKATDFTVTMTVQYPTREFAFDSPVKWWFNEGSKKIESRNMEAERRWLSTIDPNDFGFSAEGYRWEMRLPPDRFLHVVETLRESGWDVTANGAPIRIASDFDIRVTSGVDWFDLDAEVTFDDISASLPALLDALHQGEQTIVLDDGTVGMLPKDWLSKFVGIQDSGQSVDDAIRFHRSQGLLLDLLLEEHGDVRRDRDYSKFLRQLKSFDGIKAANPPRTFSGEMRDYQRIGLGWFRFLEKFGFSGCLADDMGLGKTIQVLALLDARRKRRLSNGDTRKPSIVVVPKSLIFNWLDEAAKFTPKLRVCNHTGIERKAQWDALAKNPESIDVLLTTYGTMRIDAPLLAQFEFDYAILDEAQAIKNPKSLVARASRLLPAEHRLAMTGTPVENHLGDIWSLFDFLNPGMLNNAKFSSSKLPDMEDSTQRQQVEKIGKSLRPFILRRTKSEVLTELPEKVEQTLACSMSKQQQKLYDELREHYRIHLSNKVKELGLKKAKIHVLEALLRLRQAACDPRLINPGCDVRGAKIDELMERLEELQREGRKALVFSQFTSLLSLLKQDLDARGWDYEYLDGKTRKRAERVHRFQTDTQCQLFLISLKAGGNGLNLTAAEYVFILG